MLRLGPLVQIHDREDPMRSDTTLLAAALITLGYPQAARDFFHTTSEYLRGETQWKTTWTFHGESTEPSIGILGADVVVNAWRDPAGMWLLRNAGHPVAVLRERLRYESFAAFTPNFSRQQLAVLTTPAAWVEAAVRNLVHILRHLPAAAGEARSVERFSATRAAFVPRCLPESEKTRRIKFAETTHADKRRSLLAA